MQSHASETATNPPVHRPLQPSVHQHEHRAPTEVISCRVLPLLFTPRLDLDAGHSSCRAFSAWPHIHVSYTVPVISACLTVFVLAASPPSSLFFCLFFSSVGFTRLYFDDSSPVPLLLYNCRAYIADMESLCHINTLHVKRNNRHAAPRTESV